MSRSPVSGSGGFATPPSRSSGSRIPARSTSEPCALRSPRLPFPGSCWLSRTRREAGRGFRPDVIHAHWWLPGGWFASRGKIPYLITCHGSDIRLLERGALMRRLAMQALRGAAEVTTVSNFLAGDIRRMLPSLEREVQVTPMPVDVAGFLGGARAVKVEPSRILYAGNLVPSKGVDVLLRAVAELGRREVPCRLKVLGNGPAKADLEALARELGIAPRVTWSPFVPQSQMAAEYGASTVTVLPSRGNAEGLGLTLVEALLAGSAVVGTPAGGIPEVVLNERTGLLARDGDAEDLARQIQRLLADAPLRERLTEAGKEHVLKTHSSDVAIGRFLEIYNAVADNQTAPLSRRTTGAPSPRRTVPSITGRSGPRCLRDVYRLRVEYFSARLAGELKGILAVAEVPRLLGPRRLVSLPFSYAAGPLALDGATAAALSEAVLQRALERRIRRVELKSRGEYEPAAGFQRVSHYAAYEIPTEEGEEAVWQRLHAGSTRRSIRKGQKAGLIVRRGETASDWLVMAELEERTAHGHGLPAPPRRFFVEGCRLLQSEGLADVYLAFTSAGAPAAAITVWKGPRSWIYAFGASDPAHLEHRPNHVLIWTAIQDAIAAGRRFDLGPCRPGAGRPGGVQAALGWTGPTAGL